MKYCTNCGSGLSDDARFCYKCGARLDAGVLGAERDVLMEKVARLERYNLRLDPQKLTWEYIRNLSGDELGKLVLGQDKLGEEMAALVREILDEAKDEGNALAAHETHIFVLDSCIGLSQSMREMFTNYAGLQELFNMGNQLVGQGALSPIKFLGDMKSSDSIYKQVCGIQTISAHRIRKELDCELIRRDAQCHDRAIRAADAFCRAFEAKAKRFTDFFLIPGKEYVDSEWGMFEAFLDGLSYEDVKTISESSWNSCVEAMEKHYKDGYRDVFFARMEQKHDSMRRADETAFWTAHPELAMEKTRIDGQLSLLKSTARSLAEKRSVNESQREVSARRIMGLEYELDGNRREIKRLESKIFGKAKASEKAQALRRECDEKSAELNRLRDEHDALSKNVRDLDEDIAKNAAEIANVEERLVALKRAAD